MAEPSTYKGPKIILIGLNKTGTMTFHHLFLGSGIKSVHWRDDVSGNIAKRMVSNISIARAPLEGIDATAFSDLSFASNRMVIEGTQFFPELHAAYPDAYFIYNTRPVDAWVSSRLAHANGTFASRCAIATDIDKNRLEQQWRKLFWDHRERVLWHFANHPRFLSFDISNDDPTKIATLLAPHYRIDLTHWGHCNARSRAPNKRAAA